MIPPPSAATPTLALALALALAPALAFAPLRLPGVEVADEQGAEKEATSDIADEHVVVVVDVVVNGGDELVVVDRIAVVADEDTAEPGSVESAQFIALNRNLLVNQSEHKKRNKAQIKKKK